VPVPLGGAATGVVTATVHMAGVESESPPAGVQNGVAIPAGTVLSASPSGQPIGSSPAATTASVKKPLSPGTRPPTAPATAPRKPPAGAAPLPSGLPRNRDGK
jgi:hypothetical protein